MTTTAGTRPDTRATTPAPRPPSGGQRTGWREPTYVLLFVAGVFADLISGNAKLVGFPISPDRLLFGGSLVLLLTDPVARRTVRLRWRIVHTLMVLTLAWVAFSGITAGTLGSSYGLYAFVDRLFVPFTAFTLAPVLFSTPRRRDLLLKTLTVMGIYLGMTAIFEIIGPHSLVFPRYIMNPDLGIHFGYARGPFLEAEADGLAMIACGLAAGLLVSRSQGRWRQAGIACVALCALGGLLAQERTVWISEALAILTAGLLVPRLRRLLPAVVAGIALAIGLAFGLSPALRDHVTNRAGDKLSVYDRQNTDAAAIRIIEAKPLDGIGWVRFESQGYRYVRLAPDYPITNVAIEVHNVYLSRAAETGVPGAALFVSCLLAGPFRAVARRWRPGLSPVRRAAGAATDPAAHAAVVAGGAAGDVAAVDGGAPDALGWHVVTTGVLLGWLVCSMLSPLPYPLPNLLMWLFAGIVLAPWLAPPAAASPALAADGTLVTTPAAAPATRAA